MNDFGTKNSELIATYRLREYAPGVFRGPVRCAPEAIEAMLQEGESEFMEVLNWRDALSRRVWVAFGTHSILTLAEGYMTLEIFSEANRMLEAIEFRKAQLAA